VNSSVAKIRDAKSRLLPFAETLAIPFVATVFFWLTSPNDISAVQGTAGFLLLALPFWLYSEWKRSGYQRLPLLAAITALYWLYFGLQLFWGTRLSMANRGRVVSEAAVTQTMLLVLLGMGFLLLGMKSCFGMRLAIHNLPALSSKALSVGYVQVVAILSTILSYSDTLAYSGGEGLRQLILTFESTVSLAALVILLRRSFEGKGSSFDRALPFGIVIARVLLGISSGWMGGAVALAMVLGLVYVQKKRRLPVAALLLVVPYVLFFQAGKNDFRQLYWYQETQASKLEKLEFWVDASLKRWTLALDDSTGTELRRLAMESLSRTSLLGQAANVIETTPDVVPYQYGRLYSYLAVSLIPRAFWPDKPSMNEANRFYQVAYGLTAERDLNRVSIAVGTLTEGYISFGWLGVALVMLLVGVLLDFWNHTFLDENSSAIAQGIGIALLPQLFAVEAQMAQYVSGLVQNIVLPLLVFLPVVRFHRASKRAVNKAPSLSTAGAQAR
jgi:hypothetical protein